VIRPTFAQQLDIAWRAALPVSLTLLLLFLSLLSWHLPKLGTVGAACVMASVFYWSLHQPGLMTMWGVLAVGLMHDLLTLAPFGVGLLVLLLIHGFAVSRRKAVTALPFFLIWMVFGLVAAVASVVTWLLVSIQQGQLIDIREAVRLFLLAFTCYPPLAALFAWIERRLLPGA
jgi:rod shape-determining protein MreD